MRIQHNIMAMNAYRNYSNNTKSLSGNLERLSSGYKINRAGDDAAGLAISEKMRAQITGLDAAQKNVKDGISLVKTAEGAMQEIEDMLNRMKYLATQSANGTYDNDVDRANLQKEVVALQNEIDRIADSANFNGIKLLDGSLSGAGASSSSDALEIDAAQLNAVKASMTDSGNYTAGTAGAAEVQKIDFSGLSFEKAGTVTVTLGSKTFDVDVTAGMDGKAFATALQAKVDNQIDDAAGGQFTVTDDSNGVLTFTASGNGVTANPTLAGFDMAVKDAPATAAADAAAGPTFKADATKLGAFDVADIDFSGIKQELTAESNVKLKYVGDGTDGTFTLTVDGTTYTGKVGDTSGNLNDTTLDLDDGNGGKVTLTFAAAVSNVGSDKVATGNSIPEDTVGTVAPAADDTTAAAGNGKGLTLQIGDTPDPFNQMIVSIGSMKTSAMGQDFTMTSNKDGTTTYNMGVQGKDAIAAGTQPSTQTIDQVDISDQTKAANAINTIKNAINYVSSVRGDLGAIQNRLDHTANNLSVMAENIQDAESTIRDTDVANEMMSYVKNNILVQSAQAMLAQANQVPQGVLQLLG